MPSRPLSADRKAEVQLHTRLDNEAIDVTKERTTLPAAVARLVLLVPPAREDLIVTVMERVGRRTEPTHLAWPPIATVCQLAHRVRRVHAGEMRMRGDGGVVVEVIAYRDKMQLDRKVYRVSRHGVFLGEAKSPEELARWVDLATLVEDTGPASAEG